MSKHRITSWSDEDLGQLIQLENHRVWFDGWDWWWQERVSTGEWKNQITKEFDTDKKAWSWVYYNVELWRKELDARTRSKNRALKRAKRKEARAWKKVMKIVHNTTAQNGKKVQLRDKILGIIKVMPNIEDKELAKLLETTLRYTKNVRYKP